MKRLIPFVVIILATLIGLYLQQQQPAPSTTQHEPRITKPAPPATQEEPRVSKPRTPAADGSFTEAEQTEIRNTIARIQQGERKFRQDGTTFQNREGRLPSRPNGYYKEFTVVSPGSDDRGARRIVRGKEAELYYTPDHYRTFVRINEDGELIQNQ